MPAKLSSGVVHTVPADLRAALLADPEARARWETLTPLARNEWICWTTSVKKPKTRSQHVASSKFAFRTVISIPLLALLSIPCSFAQHNKVSSGKSRHATEFHGETSFDKSFDQITDGSTSFSKDLFVSPSAARDSLENFRFGVLYRNQQSMDKAVAYPVRVIVRTAGEQTITKTLTAHNYAELSAILNSRLTKNQLAMIRCSWLGNVSIVGKYSFHPGFIIGYGLVFFERQSYSKIKVTSIDLMDVAKEQIDKTCK